MYNMHLMRKVVQSVFQEHIYAPDVATSRILVSFFSIGISTIILKVIIARIDDFALNLRLNRVVEKIRLLF